MKDYGNFKKAQGSDRSSGHGDLSSEKRKKGQGKKHKEEALLWADDIIMMSIESEKNAQIRERKKKKSFVFPFFLGALIMLIINVTVYFCFLV